MAFQHHSTKQEFESVSSISFVLIGLYTLELYRIVGEIVRVWKGIWNRWFHSFRLFLFLLHIHIWIVVEWDSWWFNHWLYQIALSLLFDSRLNGLAYQRRNIRLLTLPILIFDSDYDPFSFTDDGFILGTYESMYEGETIWSNCVNATPKYNRVRISDWSHKIHVDGLQNWTCALARKKGLNRGQKLRLTTEEKRGYYEKYFMTGFQYAPCLSRIPDPAPRHLILSLLSHFLSDLFFSSNRCSG